MTDLDRPLMVDEVADRVLTEPEVAELLRCTPASVRRLARKRHIVRVPPLRPPRYLRSSVERLIDLDDDAFSRLAPLAVGLVAVEVELLAPPETDADG